MEKALFYTLPPLQALPLAAGASLFLLFGRKRAKFARCEIVLNVIYTYLVEKKKCQEKT